MSSFRFSGSFRSLKITFATALKARLMGPRAKMIFFIGLTIHRATASGDTIAARLGITSANSTKAKVTKKKEPADAAPSVTGRGTKSGMAEAIKGEMKASPTTPASMATALRPICTVVKNIPGCS